MCGTGAGEPAAAGRNRTAAPIVPRSVTCSPSSARRPGPGRRWAAAGAGAALVIAIVTSLPAAAAATATPRASAGAAWRGHGTLAFVSGGHLVLLDTAGARTVVPGGGVASQPAVSADGAWVAFLSRGPAPRSQPYALPAPSLWVVRPDGRDRHRVAGDVAGFAWSPSGDRLVLTTSVGDGCLLLVRTPLARPLLIAAGAAHLQLGGAAWSPAGTSLAVSVITTSRSGIPATGGIAIVPAQPLGALRVVYRERGSGIEDLSWWPDGRGVVFWRDLVFSQSIAADGLPLESLRLGGGTPRRLVTALAYPSWLAWSPSGRMLAVVAGGDRLVWGGDKGIALCRMPAGVCRRLPQPAGVISYQPAWSPQGALTFVRAQASGPFGPDQFNVAVGRLRAWDATQRIWTDPEGGATPSPLAPLARGALRPVWTPSGLLYVRDDGLWLLGDAAGRPPVEVAGPLTTPQPGLSTGFPDVYYGYQGWSQLFAVGR